MFVAAILSFFKSFSSALIIVHLLYNYRTLEHFSGNPEDLSENRAEFRSLEHLPSHIIVGVFC